MRLRGKAEVEEAFELFYNTWLLNLKAFLNFCVEKHEWIPKSPANVLKPRSLIHERATLTPDQIERMLRGTFAMPNKLGPMMRMYLSLAVFAGIRPCETQRVEWEMLRFDSHKIALPARITKTRRPRTFPMEPNLKAWLLTCNPGTGPFYNQANHRRQLDAVRETAGLRKEWIQDGLRHTYASAMYPHR